MEAIVIKKYTNRRLYHTGEKQYITLEQVEQLIREGHEVKVIAHQTNEDITEETLLQIILGSEKPRNIFSSDLLHQIIRLQEDHLQEFLRFYLKTSLEYFAKFMKNVAQQFNMWSEMFGSMMPGMPPFHSQSGLPFSSPSDKPLQAEILANIQKRLVEYEKKIQKLEARLKERPESKDSS